MGVRLIERTTRAMSLTEDGRHFYERVRPSLEEIAGRGGKRVMADDIGLQKNVILNPAVDCDSTPGFAVGLCCSGSGGAHYQM
jgi:hypothetical protein